VRSITTKFPFDPRAAEDVEPEELEAAFHPTRGAFFQLFRSYLEPVSAFGDGQAFRPLPSSSGALRPPADLYPTVNAVAALAARLWDAEGNPKPLTLSVTPVPFTTHSKDLVVPTVVQLNVGSASLFNFNQKPTRSELAIAWSEDEPAQLAVQAVNVETRETFHPAALSADGPHWRFFRLLAAAKRLRDADGHVYEWHRPAKDGERPTLRVRLRFDNDPWLLLSLSAKGRAR
jgi:type VI protein secretion system component VasK